MKRTIVASVALATLLLPAIAVGKPRAPRVAATSSPAATGDLPAAPTSAADLASLGSEPNETWGSLDDTSRYLLIMGTADGFAAAGGPCFPGQDNSKLAAALKAAGLDSESPLALTDALAKLSASKEQCALGQRRGYTTDLLKGMPNEHLALYLTGVARGYAKVAGCPVENQGLVAANIATELFSLMTATQPADLIKKTIQVDCAFTPR